MIGANNTGRMVAGVCGWAKLLREQLNCARLTAEGEQGEIEFGGAAGVRDGIFLEKADALAKRSLASLAVHDADSACESHDYEIGFDGVVIEIEEQLKQASGGPEERHFAAPQITLERVELPPELVEVLPDTNSAGDLEAFEISGE